MLSLMEYSDNCVHACAIFCLLFAEMHAKNAYNCMVVHANFFSIRNAQLDTGRTESFHRKFFNFFQT